MMATVSRYNRYLVQLRTINTLIGAQWLDTTSAVDQSECKVYGVKAYFM